jgi:hypothetical protein
LRQGHQNGRSLPAEFDILDGDGSGSNGGSSDKVEMKDHTIWLILLG